ncbi:MAG: hypothetical protein JNJ85_10115 [Candidatus Kapabacteria bacterium]|nr:hypothetical protein [Candidatus Kapabacteria bacterium]
MSGIIYSFTQTGVIMKSIAKLTAGVMAAAIVGFGMFLNSCSMSESPVSTGESVGMVQTTTNTEFTNYDVTLSDFAITDEMGGATGDPGKGSSGDGGRDTTVKGGGRDTTVKGGPGNSGRFRMLPIPCLGLDSNQMQAIRALMEQYNQANKAANEAFKLAMEPLRAQDKAAMDAYKAATADVRKQLAEISKNYRTQAQDIIKNAKASGATRDEINAQLKDLRDKFNAETQALRDQLAAAQADLKAALQATAQAKKDATLRLQEQLKANQKLLYDGIYNLLTDAQKALWDAWLAGKDPCAGKGPRG